MKDDRYDTVLKPCHFVSIRGLTLSIKDYLRLSAVDLNSGPAHSANAFVLREA